VSANGSDVDETTALAQLVALIRRYGSLPEAVFGLISLYILQGIFDVVSIVVGSILYVFDLVVGSIDAARLLLLEAFGAVGADVLGTLVAFQREIATVIESAGPAGPPIAVGATAVLLYVGYRVAVALLGEIPGGSSLVDILGLR